MKLKTQLTMLALLTAILLPHSSLAATFCGSRTNVGYGGGSTMTGDLDANFCQEVGAWNYGGEGGYAGTAINVNMLEGSLLSVLGFMKDSVVNSGAEVYVTKVSKLTYDGYDSTSPAIASNITVYSGGLIRVFDGGTLQDSYLDGGSAYITNHGTTGSTGLSINNEVSNEGELYVFSNGVSTGTKINQNGYEFVQQSGTSTDAQINGGFQYVILAGTANGATVNDKGFQYVYNGGIANDTVVNDGGTQYLLLNSSSATAVAGVANNTTVNGTGTQLINQGAKATNVTLNGSALQRIYALSSSENVTLNDSATQVINGNAVATNVTLNNSAKSWLASGASIAGVTQVNENAQLQLTASADGGAWAENVILNGSDTTVLVIANSSDSDTASIQTLSGDGNVRFYSTTDDTTGDAIYSRLNIDSLSGNVHFYFNTSLEGGRGDYLYVTNGAGNHYVTAADSGVEITEPGQRSLDLITDASSGASFSLASLSGTNINAVDGGTYMYSLYDREDTEGKTWYLAAEKEEVIPPVTEPETPPTEPEPPAQPDEETPPVTQPEIPAVIPDSARTTPATDAVLSMSVAPVLMFKNEMQNLRFRQGFSEKTDGDSGAWVRFTGGNSKINSGYTNFKLEQSGLELGIDHILETDDSKTRIGLFTSYNNGDVKHARGGTSSIDSLSVGAQATWFHNDGWYVDGILKYNRFDNTLNTVSTNGSGVSGDFNQHAFGAALEVGKNIRFDNNAWVEPYAKVAAIQLKGQDVKLNNGMKGEIDDQNSISTELGVNVGHTFTLDKGTTLTPYIKAAWVHEYVDNNSTTINDRNTFTTDLSGDQGKVGLGINASFNKELSVFAELDYAKGDKQEDPVQANLGIRYSF